MTFYKILNNIIKISPPSGLLTRSHNRHHYIVPRSRLDTVVYSFYPRAIRIWNTIPKAITEISKPESFQAAISKLPFSTPIHLKCLYHIHKYNILVGVRLHFTATLEWKPWQHQHHGRRGTTLYSNAGVETLATSTLW